MGHPLGDQLAVLARRHGVHRPAVRKSGYTSTFVIESGTSGVDLTNLRDYIADKSAFIAIKRFKQPWFDEAKQSRVRGLLLDKIKATYNYWAIGTIARNLWFGVERSVSGDRKTMRRFRERKWDAPTEFICSGLVQIGFVEAALEYIKAGTLPPTALNEVVFEQRGGDAAARARGLGLSRRRSPRRRRRCCSASRTSTRCSR